MSNIDFTLDELHSRLQSFGITAILNRPDGKVTTDHFIIAIGAGGTYTITEKKVEARWMVSRIVARELEEKGKKSKRQR